MCQLFIVLFSFFDATLPHPHTGQFTACKYTTKYLSSEIFKSKILFMVFIVGNLRVMGRCWAKTSRRHRAAAGCNPPPSAGACAHVSE
jgi:hypothetical protein